MNDEKSDEKDTNPKVIPTLVAIGTLALGLLLGMALDENKFTEVAVERGHAEWYIEDHEREWRWKKCDFCAPMKVTE